MKPKSFLTRNIWVLSLISLLADISSEMLYPVMPLYLRSIGLTPLFIGVLEGFAEATAGVSKAYFGRLSDATGERVKFIRWGYALSGLSKSMMALWAAAGWVLLARTTDRLGKGLRTGARDALLSAESTPQNKAKVFGFHRSMDTLGATLGPIVAVVFLFYFPAQYVWLFLLAFIPAMFSIWLTFFIRQPKPTPSSKPAGSFFKSFSYWKEATPAYRRLVAGLLLFALFNSSDMFLLMQLKEQGLDEKMVIIVYIFYNAVYALAAFPFGVIADRLGVKNVLLLGLLLFAGAYFGVAFPIPLSGLLAVFFIYGLYAAATEGVARAWICSICPVRDAASAVGTFAGLSSLAALAASSSAGWIWYVWGSNVLFLWSAGGALAAFLFLALWAPKPVIQKG